MKEFFIILFITISASYSYSQESITLTRSIWLYTKEIGDIKHRIAIPRGTTIPIVRTGDQCRSGFGSTKGYIECIAITDQYQKSIQTLPGMPNVKSGYATIRSGANASVIGKLLMIGGIGLSLATIKKQNNTTQYIALGAAGLGLLIDLGGTGAIARGAKALDSGIQ